MYLKNQVWAQDSSDFLNLYFQVVLQLYMISQHFVVILVMILSKENLMNIILMLLKIV